MARALWTNEPFSDGRTPRDIARLPASVADAFKELETLTRQRRTTLRAASGTLSQGEGDSIRKAVLSIVFKAMGLPAKYDEARALLWLPNEGIEDAVRAALKQKQRDLERELRDLTVASHLHGILFAHRREDEALLQPSYPLLPTRQRLGERVLTTTDASGTGMQLRSQLRLAFDAVRKSKYAPLGHIVGGDFIYDEIRMRLRQSSQISSETANAIDQLDGAADAARAGINSAIVFAHVALPCKDELVRAIITRAAAERTLAGRKHTTHSASRRAMPRSESPHCSARRSNRRRSFRVAA